MIQPSLFDFIMSDPTLSYDVVCLSSMAERKSATIAGRRICLSPAMFDLYRNANNEEVKHLLKNIPVYVIGSRETIKNLTEAAIYENKKIKGSSEKPL